MEKVLVERIREYNVFLDRYNLKENDISIFFTKNYMDYLCGKRGEFFYVVSKKYAIPVVVKKKYFFKYAILVFQPIVITSEENNESQRNFLDSVVEFLKKKHRIHWINPTSAYTTFCEHPSNSKYIPFGNCVIDLFEDEELLFKKMDGKHRNVIKKAEKDGVVVKYGYNEELLRDYLVLDKQTWDRSNSKGHSYEYYEEIIKKLPSNTIIFMAYYEDEPQASALFYYDNDVCYYMYGATANKPHTGANNYLHWLAIKYMKEKGTHYYSFVGYRYAVDKNSKYEGIQRFKSRFGGVVVPGYMFKVVCNKFYYNLYKMYVYFRTGKKKIDPIDDEYEKWKELEHLTHNHSLQDSIDIIINKNGGIITK